MGMTEIQAADEIYAVARQKADAEMTVLRGEMDAVRAESFALGVLKKIEYDRAHNEMLKYVVLHRIKQAKDYRKGGMTWAGFCEAIGEPMHAVDRITKDLLPLYEAFSGKLMELSGVGLSKIRYLGRSISSEAAAIEDNHLVIDGNKIPIDPEHKEEIEAAIDAMRETGAEALEEANASIRAKEKVLESKEKVIQKQEKDLMKLEKAMAHQTKSPFSEDVEKFNTNTETLAKTLIEMTSALVESVPENASGLMKSAVLEALATIHRHVIAMHREAMERYEDPEVYNSPLDSADNFGANAVYPEDMKDFWTEGPKYIPPPSATPDPDAK